MLDDKRDSRGDEYQDNYDSTHKSVSGLGLTRDTRATVEQVLDPRTLAILKKLQKRKVYQTMEGCISTGKEANVYYAQDEAGKDLAVKVYKTSILTFKDRDEYVDGEFRFRRGYCKSNPRKMVAVWAEKEQRNLRRLGQAGIPCPAVVSGSQNVLVMTLIGADRVAALRLKEVSDPLREWVSVYLDAVRLMRRMYQECRLVHGDLSEYNMLMDNEERLYVIDVSQSVEHAHPRALDFLKRDCFNINAFFEKRDVPVIRLPSLFDFIVSATAPPQQQPPELDVLDTPTVIFNTVEEETWLQNTLHFNPASAEDDDAVFLETWIPTSLAQVGDFKEIELDIARRNDGENTLFDRLVATPEASEETSDSDSDSNSDSESSSSSDGSSCGGDKDGRDGHRPEGISRAEWKKIVKEERREARKHKVPKHMKRKRNVKKFGSRR